MHWRRAWTSQLYVFGVSSLQSWWSTMAWEHSQFLVVAGQWENTATTTTHYIYIYNYINIILLHYVRVELFCLLIHVLGCLLIHLFAPGMLRVSNWTMPKQNNSLKDSKVEPIVLWKKFIPSLQFLYVKNIYLPEVGQFAPWKVTFSMERIVFQPPIFQRRTVKPWRCNNHMGVSKNRGTPKWMISNGNPEIPIKLDDLGGNLPFSETPPGVKKCGHFFFRPQNLSGNHRWDFSPPIH